MNESIKISSFNTEMQISNHNSDQASNQETRAASLAKYACIHNYLTEMTSPNSEKNPEETNSSVYYSVFKSMINNLKNHEDLFKSGAKMLQENQKYQQKLMKELREIHYLDLPDDVTDMPEIERIHNANLGIDGQKATVQALVDVARQKTSLEMSNIKIDMQGEVRMAAELSNYGDKLGLTIEEILQLTKRN